MKLADSIDKGKFIGGVLGGSLDPRGDHGGLLCSPAGTPARSCHETCPTETLLPSFLANLGHFCLCHWQQPPTPGTTAPPSSCCH